MSERRPALLLVLALALLGPAAPASAADPQPAAAEPGRWGLGWIDDGVTLRVAPGRGWEVELAGGPRDRRQDATRYYREFDEGELEEYREPEHDTSESGWVRLFLSRRLLRQGRLSLSLAAGGEHGWADGQTRRFLYRGVDMEYRTVLQDTYERDWAAMLVLRPRYRLLARATIEFSFGFAYEWDDYESDSHDADPGSLSWEHLRRTEEARYFSTWGGWSGLGSLGLMVWF